jgi:hypothetical protein
MNAAGRKGRALILSPRGCQVSVCRSICQIIEDVGGQLQDCELWGSRRHFAEDAGVPGLLTQYRLPSI